MFSFQGAMPLGSGFFKWLNTLTTIIKIPQKAVSNMPKPENFITFRVTQEEKELLKQYCDQEGRTQTDILRELIRSLRRRLKPLRIHEGSALGGADL